MPAITAVFHTTNDALRLGRALETLYACDEIVVVDHGSVDGTLRVAREYGARIISAANGKKVQDHLHGWILCLDPREALTEALAASLFEWKSQALSDNAAGFSVFLREETNEGWVGHAVAQTRLVRADWPRWNGNFPMPGLSDLVLAGELLRLSFP
jgi:glycosyltransferase involved in cell wall biosynthesis